MGSRRFVVAIGFLCAMPGLVSAEVYRWVDKDGNVHFGDHIPKAYEAQGETLDIDSGHPSARERKSAEAIAESAREAADAAREYRHEQAQRAEEAGAKPSEVKPQQAEPQSLPESPGPGTRLTHEQQQERYEAQMRRYRESQRCFAPYKVVGGGTKGEAFKHCTPVPRPKYPGVD